MNLADRLRVTVQKLRRTPMPISDVAPLLTEAADRIQKLEEAIENLIKVKGSYHTQQAYERLIVAFGEQDGR